jgi:hypothetical protein
MLDFRRDTQRSDLPEQKSDHTDIPLEVHKKARPMSAYTGKSFGLPPRSL